MPYNMRNLPEPMKGKSKKSKEIFIATFNSVLKDSGKEDQAFAIAYAAVDKHEKKVKQLKKSQGDLPWHLKAALQLPVEIEQNHVGVVKSVNAEKRLATFLVLEPQDSDLTTSDLHFDWYDESVIEDSCYNFNRFCMKANLLHQISTTAFEFVESYITKSEMNLNGLLIKKGSWLATILVNKTPLGDEIWEGIKNGTFNGLSIQAMAEIEYLED